MARQIAESMTAQQLTKREMASRMHTSRAALDRLLDPDHLSVTLSTLTNAARVLGRQLRLELV